LQALRSGRQGSIEQRLNDSKGCGGVMRVAPVGLAGYEPFKLGCDVAALTHGHPSGFLAAGFFASMIAAIVDGQSLTDSIAAATVELEGYPGHQECLTAVDRAVTLSRAGSPSAEQVESLGAGWVAEEALAIGLYCALVADGDFEQGMRLAVNHGGDSDSTGSLTGQLLGALLGLAAIPERWRAIVEIRVVVEQVAIDLYEHFGRQGGVRDDAADWRKYPGW
jgi:ADP-ribosylglycohydrolase